MRTTRVFSLLLSDMLIILRARVIAKSDCRKWGIDVFCGLVGFVVHVALQVEK